MARPAESFSVLIRLFGMAFLMVFALGLVSGCAQVIEDGTAGVKFDFGKISDRPLGTGWHFYFPVTTTIERWDIKTQEIKESAAVPSSEGLISTLDVSVLYNVPQDKIILVRKTIGRDYVRTVIDPYVREAIRNVASGYEVKALFSDKGRNEIGMKILEFLQSKLEPRGIIIQDVLLRDVQLPPAFAQSISLKLKTEQEALQKEFELQKARKDAEIEIARAMGVAKANEIIAGSITEGYLRYRWVEGLQKSDMQVVYVPTEANLPVMEASRWKVIEDRKAKQ
jgi:regulator of protease activity HflC (stomatin/prohibitin superfamily)